MLHISRSTLSNALHVAAEAYEQDAYHAADSSNPGLWIQFRRQAQEARKLAELIEQNESDLVTLTD